MVSENEEVLNWKEDFGRKYQDLPVNEGGRSLVWGDPTR